MNEQQNLPPLEKIRNQVVELSDLSYFQRRVYLSKKAKVKYPRFFYRYIFLDPENTTSVDRLRNIIVDSKLWFNSISQFNDPFDTKMKIVIEGDDVAVRKRIDETLSHSEHDANSRREHVDSFTSNLNFWSEKIYNMYNQSFNEIGICCFSLDSRNILMWSHYAKNHKGIVLQFEVAKDPQRFLYTFEVNYVKDYPINNWVNEPIEELAKCIFNKFKSWSYEREYRAMYSGGANKSLDFIPEALTGLIFGCKADESVKEKIRQLLTERSQKLMPSVNIYNSYLHDSKYALVIKK